MKKFQIDIRNLRKEKAPEKSGVDADFSGAFIFLRV
nr:MAG TPA: hypothetical protein [Caudoviricetes sp.]